MTSFSCKLYAHDGAHLSIVGECRSMDGFWDGGGSQCSVREFKDRCFCYTADEKESAKPHDSGSQVQPPSIGLQQACKFMIM